MIEMLPEIFSVNEQDSVEKKAYLFEKIKDVLSVLVSPGKQREMFDGYHEDLNKAEERGEPSESLLC